jgi:autotransporter adhesin
MGAVMTRTISTAGAERPVAAQISPSGGTLRGPVFGSGMARFPQTSSSSLLIAGGLAICALAWTPQALAQTVSAPATAAGCVENVGQSQFACASGSTANGVGAVAVGKVAQATGANSTAIGLGATANADGSTAIGNSANNGSVAGVNSTAVGFAAAAWGDSSTAVGGSQFSSQTLAKGTNSSVFGSFAKAGGTGSSAFANAGTTALGATAQAGTTALGQTNATAVGFAALANGANATATGANSSASNTSASAYGSASNASGVNATAIGQSSSASADGATAVGSSAQATATGAVAVGLSSAATGRNAIAIGNGAIATGSVAVGAAASAANGGAAFGDGAVATGSLATALGPNSQALGANSVAIGSGSVATLANTVSFGTPGNERRLTNVAAGVNPTDAVNVSQLSGLTSGFQSQITGLQGQITSNLSESRRGIAATAALASVATPSAPGKTTMAMNASTYEGQAGFGIALTHRLAWTDIPVYVSGAYGNGGGTQHVGRVGMAVEW